jgi:MoxR-like ATPase
MTTQSTSGGSQKPEEIVRRVTQARKLLLKEVHKVIIGQDEMIEQMLVCIFARGHCLTIGVPGLAKTLTVSTLAEALAMDFSRIQFTPDLMPSDITGTEIIDSDPATGERSFRFIKGPVFANIVLADEINRTPPKTQAALLQAMQEYEVTSSGKTYALEPPFFVMATQNPIEQEGTYPLPEAQLDRFMLSIHIGYPSREEEREIVHATTQTIRRKIEPVLQSRDILKIQQLVRQVPVSDHMVDYAVDLVRATRPKEEDSPDFVKNWLAWGAGPRAAQNLILGAKARAILNGRFTVSSEDIRKMAYPVLRHRLFTNFNADAEGIDVDEVIARILESIQEPDHGDPVAAESRRRKEAKNEMLRKVAHDLKKSKQEAKQESTRREQSEKKSSSPEEKPPTKSEGGKSENGEEKTSEKTEPPPSKGGPPKIEIPDPDADSPSKRPEMPPKIDPFRRR